jgi:hypothetical protein
MEVSRNDNENERIILKTVVFQFWLGRIVSGRLESDPFRSDKTREGYYLLYALW